MKQGYVRVCAVDDVPEEGVTSVEVNDTKVAIARSQGEVHAILDRCSHADVPLSEGDVHQTTIECWLHGSTFDLRTGKATCLPATEPVPVFGAEVLDGDVYVQLVREN